MEEQACEHVNTCNQDQVSFKAYFSSWLAATTVLAPFTYDTIAPLLASSAKSAAAQCTGGNTKTQCGFKWADKTPDGNFGIGPSMSALAVVQSSIVSVPFFQPKKVDPGTGQPASSNPSSPAADPSDPADVNPSFAPVTNSTGGTSVGDPAAGVTNGGGRDSGVTQQIVTTTRDTVAASFLTVGILASMIGGSVIMIYE